MSQPGILKPCPFCNSPDVEFRKQHAKAYVACNNCGARTGIAYFVTSDASNAYRLNEVINAWNTRTPEAATTIARLVEVLFDWRNSYLCPATDFEAQVERLLEKTDTALSLTGEIDRA